MEISQGSKRVSEQPVRITRDRDRDVDVVVLAGTVGHESHWTRGLPRPLLPLAGGTIIETLLTRLSSAFDGRFLLCANGPTEMLRETAERVDFGERTLEHIEDSIPRGTAGCLKMCESRLESDTLFVIGGSVWLEDDPQDIVAQHHAQGNALTVVCVRERCGQDDSPWSDDGVLKPTGIFCCQREILKYIRAVGFQDLKEQLIPALQKAGLRVGAVTLNGETREVADWPGYVHALDRSIGDPNVRLPGFRQLADDIWCGEEVEIADQARIVGPAVIGHRCRIENGAVVVGPTILGDDCTVGAGAWLIRVVACEGQTIPQGASATERLMQPMIRHRMRRTRSATSRAGSAVKATNGRPVRQSVVVTEPQRQGMKMITAAAMLCAAFGWAFWHEWTTLWTIWQTDPDYSAGQLAPLAAVFMLVTRHNEWRKLRFSFWSTGLVVFAAGWLINLAGAYLLFTSMQLVGMVICANGLAMTLVGRQVYRHMWYPLAFLFLMLPLPRMIHESMMIPLQGVGAVMAASTLEVIGVPVVRFGNVLEVSGHQVAVAEACSGLRMVLAFLIVTGVAAYTIRRPRWQKVLVLLSSIPIALVCNAGRIVLLAYLYSIEHVNLAQGFFHEATGLMMMPIAVGLVALEFWFLSNLVGPEPASATVPAYARVARR